MRCFEAWFKTKCTWAAFNESVCASTDAVLGVSPEGTANAGRGSERGCGGIWFNGAQGVVVSGIGGAEGSGGGVRCLFEVLTGQVRAL